MALFCTSCGAQLPESARNCPACGKAVGSGAGPSPGASPATATTAATGGLADNVAGALAYVTFIPAVIFLVLEPYNRNRFIRFHSFHSIFFQIAWVVLSIVLNIILHIPFVGWATILVWPIIWLGGFILWLVLVIKAYQGQMFKLPVIGDMAEKQANAV